MQCLVRAKVCEPFYVTTGSRCTNSKRAVSWKRAFGQLPVFDCSGYALAPSEHSRSSENWQESVGITSVSIKARRSHERTCCAEIWWLMVRESAWMFSTAQRLPWYHGAVSGRTCPIQAAQIKPTFFYSLIYLFYIYIWVFRDKDWVIRWPLHSLVYCHFSVVHSGRRTKWRQINTNWSFTKFYPRNEHFFDLKCNFLFPSGAHIF